MTFSKSEYKVRVSNAQSKLGGLDALFVTKEENLRYFTGVDSGRLLITKDGARYWLNEVYFDRAKDSPVRPAKSKKDAVKKFILSRKYKKVGIDSVTLQDYRALDPDMRKVFRPSDICTQLRKIKSKEELRLLARAGKIASDAMALVNESKIVGMTDFELSGLLEYEIRKMGSEKPPFGGGLLCLIGRNTGYPHAPPIGRKVKDSDLVILDLGAVYQGYHSDMTRTFRIGKIPKEAEKIDDLVTRLKEDAIEKVQVGGKISEIHKFVESEMKKAGYKFYHLTGHGVGLEIHEAPSIGPDSKDEFCDGMVFTIEPGIYTTRFGARDEDTIALASGKKRVLTIS